MVEIVKVQIVACQDDRDRVTLQRLPGPVRRTVAEHGKRYFTAAWHPHAGGWAIGDLVAEQAW